MKIISYLQLATNEGVQVQKGMNFNIKKFYSIVLMSTLKNAPYVDKLLDDGIIEYEGHDARKSSEYNKKEVDQPMANQNGVLTENGKFFQAADNFKSGKREPAKIKVYRKLRDKVDDGKRTVFKFLLKPNFEDIKEETTEEFHDLQHDRMIPGEIQREVFERDQGKCRQCSSNENLHFDHILPYSKGGSSKIASNIQLLCAKHNLRKGAKFL